MKIWRWIEGLPHSPGDNIKAEDEKWWQNCHCKGSQGQSWSASTLLPLMGSTSFPAEGHLGLLAEGRESTMSGNTTEPRLGSGSSSALGGCILDSGTVLKATFLPPVRWHVPKPFLPYSCRSHFYPSQSSVAEISPSSVLMSFALHSIVVNIWTLELENPDLNHGCIYLTRGALYLWLYKRHPIVTSILRSRK